jgi:hypothetical protein
MTDLTASPSPKVEDKRKWTGVARLDSDINVVSPDENRGRSKLYLYEGTLQGWITKHSTVLLSACFVLTVSTLVAIMGIIYFSANTDLVLEGEECWPIECHTSTQSSTHIELSQSYYHEPPASHNISYIDEWKFSLPAPTNRDIKSVIYYNSFTIPGHFLAVGSKSTVLSSQNGLDWILLPPGPTEMLVVD